MSDSQSISSGDVADLSSLTVPEITQAELDAAEAAMLAAKEGDDPAARAEAMQAFGELRCAWKLQEETAGRRSAQTAVVHESHVAPTEEG